MQSERAVVKARWLNVSLKSVGAVNDLTPRESSGWLCGARRSEDKTVTGRDWCQCVAGGWLP